MRPYTGLNAWSNVNGLLYNFLLTMPLEPLERGLVIKLRRREFTYFDLTYLTIPTRTFIIFIASSSHLRMLLAQAFH